MSSLSGTYLVWRTSFVRNLCREPAVPWDDPIYLSPAERGTVLESIKQFQLGEGASGRTFSQLAEAESERLHLAELPDAIAAFIREEQRHSGMLARFLLREGAELATKHWVSDGFRWLRKRLGFGFMVAVLSAAEVLAFRYYRGLAKATKSPLLRAICRHILREEVDHLHFQALNLAMSVSGRPSWMRPGLLALQRLLLEGMTILLCWEHRTVLNEVGGYRATIHTARKLLRTMHAECRQQCDRWKADEPGKLPRNRTAKVEVEFVRNPAPVLHNDDALTADQLKTDLFREPEAFQ